MQSQVKDNKDIVFRLRIINLLENLSLAMDCELLLFSYFPNQTLCIYKNNSEV